MIIQAKEHYLNKSSKTLNTIKNRLCKIIIDYRIIIMIFLIIYKHKTQLMHLSKLIYLCELLYL